MRVRVHAGTLAGTVEVPGDKSVSHRALVLGALVGAPVEVSGLAVSEDVDATVAALRAMGVDVKLERAGDRRDGQVTGPIREPVTVLDCRNSGTALRLLAGVAAGHDGLTVLTGDPSLRTRPVDRVAVPLREMGARVDARDGGRLPPLVVRGAQLRGIRYEQAVASAQVKSCLLIAGLRAQGRTSVISPLPSRDHTERMLRHLGAEVLTAVTSDGRDGVAIEPGELTAASLRVPRDTSSAAFWHVAAAVGAGGITTRSVCVNPTRTGALAVLEEMGADVAWGVEQQRGSEPVADVTVRSSELSGIQISGRRVVDAIDELPVLALAGARSRDGFEVAEAGELRVKESDRIATLGAAFRALGLELQERPDGFRVPGGQVPKGGVVDPAGDHRIAMTAAIAGCIAEDPVEIVGFEAVATSYPSFLDHLLSLGGRAEVLEA